MKPPNKLLLAVLAAGSVTSLAFFSWSAKAKDDATFHLANGIDVTPVEVVPDDITAALDAHIWKFDVLLPDTNKSYNYRLLLCSHGKIVSPLGGIGFGPAVKPETGNPNVQVTVGMVPIDNTFAQAQRIKFNIHTSGGGTMGVFANPFKGTGEYNEDVQVSEPSNTIYLMSGDKSQVVYGYATEHDTSVALEIEPLVIKH